MNKETIIGVAKYGIFGLACLIVIVFLRNKLLNVNTIPKEMQLQYLPADFNPEINEAEALIILKNPYRYATEFEELIFKLNTSLILHIATRMGLNEMQKQEALAEYGKHHSYLKDLYFEDFLKLQEDVEKQKDQWYANESSQAISSLNEVASKYTCFLSNHVITSVLKTQGGKLLVKGKKVETPCGLALNEGLKPMINRLKEKAAIDDFSRSRSMIMEKTEEYIAELAIVKVTEKKGINEQLYTKLFGLNISSTEIEITALSVMKIGFDLNAGFEMNIDDKQKAIIIEVPEPSILSHEVSPRIDKLDIGFLEGLDKESLNKNINKLRKAFVESSYTEDVRIKAKEKLSNTLDNILFPRLDKLPNEYKIVINFTADSVENKSYSETINF